MPVKYYAAGNFVFMSSPEKERIFREKHREVFGEDYNRLTSFFFKRETKTMLKIKEEEA